MLRSDPGPCVDLSQSSLTEERAGPQQDLTLPSVRTATWPQESQPQWGLEPCPIVEQSGISLGRVAGPQ